MNVKAERRVFIEIAAEARSVEPFISPAIIKLILALGAANRIRPGRNWADGMPAR